MSPKPGRKLFRIRRGFLPVSAVGITVGLAGAWFTQRPAAATILSAAVIAAFVLENTCGGIALGWILAVVGRSVGAFSWPVFAIAAALSIPVVPTVMALVDFVDHEIVEVRGPLGRTTGRVVLAWWLGWMLPWGILVWVWGYAGWRAALLVLVPTVLASLGRNKSALAASVVVWLIDGRVLVAGGLAALAVVNLVAPLLAPAPLRHVPLRRPRLLDGPVGAARLAAVDRAIRRGDNRRALRRLGSAQALRREGRAAVRARLALLALDDGRYQEVLDAATPVVDLDAPEELTLQWARAEALVAINRVTEALHVLKAIAARARPHTRAEKVCFGLSLSRMLARAGEHEHCITEAQSVLSGLGWREWPLERAEARRVIAEAHFAQNRLKDAADTIEQAFFELMTNKWMRDLWTRGNDHRRLFRLASGARGRLFLESLRVDLVYRRIRDARLSPSEVDQATLHESTAVADILAVQGQWEILADLMLAKARFVRLRDRDGEAQEFLLRGLRELDRNRYALRSPRDRAAWSERLRETLAAALELALESGDVNLQVELMEFARIQAIPHLSPGNATTSDEIALMAPPVLRVRGAARLSRHWDASRPPPVDLEMAAALAAGSGTWWLSYWHSGSWLYWGLVPPEGPVAAGRIEFTSDSPLSGALREMARNLPVLLEGESQADIDVRLNASFLLTDAASERRASAQLAQLLLPAPLLASLRLRGREPRPLPLAIAPTAAIAFVPWSSLVLERAHGDEPLNNRLVHVADWVLAPAASLVAALPARSPRAEPKPLRLAVVDTWQSDQLPALEAARRQAIAFPPQVHILGGAHWTDRIATAAALRTALGSMPRHSTALFACHALPTAPDLSVHGGLVLAEATSDDHEVPQLLTARGILQLAASGSEMPDQVLLLACDSSDLGATAGGEWLTAAPAILAAGATTAISTLYPILDVTDGNDPIIDAALAGDDLRAAVRGFQRNGADAWDSGRVTRLDQCPLVWGAYAAVGAYRGAVEPGSPILPDFSPRLRELLNTAAHDASNVRGHRVSTGHLLSAYLMGSASSEFIEASVYGLIRDALLLTVPRVLRARNSAVSFGGLNPSTELVEAARAALQAAKHEARDIEPEDILRVAVQTPSPARRLLRMLTWTNLQRADQMLNVLDHTLANALLGNDRDMSDAPSMKYEQFVSGLQKMALREPRA